MDCQSTRAVGWWYGLEPMPTVLYGKPKKDLIMELRLSDGWYLINPRQIRSVAYYLRRAVNFYNKKYEYCSPDVKLQREISEGGEKHIEILDTEWIEKHLKDLDAKWIIAIEVLRQKENQTFEIPFETKGEADKFYNEICIKLNRKFGLNRLSEKSKKTPANKMPNKETQV